VDYENSIILDSHKAAGRTVSEAWSALLRRPDRFLSLTPAVFSDPAITNDEYCSRYRETEAVD
jgi:hypothetical protein